jgi:hypothetical protein
VTNRFVRDLCAEVLASCPGPLNVSELTFGVEPHGKSGRVRPDRVCSMSFKQSPGWTPGQARLTGTVATAAGTAVPAQQDLTRRASFPQVCPLDPMLFTAIHGMSSPGSRPDRTKPLALPAVTETTSGTAEANDDNR